MMEDMMNTDCVMTAEYVSEGHPDKLADQISDAILDEYLKVDPYSRVACECLVTGSTVVVAGEITSSRKPLMSIPEIVRKVFNDVGYTSDSLGFDINSLEIVEKIQKQGCEISNAVNKDDGSLGAGDQGIMIGYATSETPEMMPLPVAVARSIIQMLTEFRHEQRVDFLRPDAKCQVSANYYNGICIGLDTIIVSTQHVPGVDQDELETFIKEDIVYPVHLSYGIPEVGEILVNPAGEFTQGGPGSDTGLTGRKIVVDAYGPFCPVGGGAFSGKDATKVDRSGAYMARYIAKNIVAAKIATECTVQLSFVIGQAAPVSLMIDLHSTGRFDTLSLENEIRATYDFTPQGIIEFLDLRKPRYKETAASGHFGNKKSQFLWESIGMLSRQRAMFGMCNVDI